jgi:hypothetical protein
MNEMVVAREFNDIPTHLSELREQGVMLVHVRVDAQGNAEAVAPGVLREISQYPPYRNCPTVISADGLSGYVRNSISEWKFRSLVVDGKSVPYRGWLQVFFWHGAFLEQAAY